MLLEGKSALVTGAGQGIGREIALALAREGCDVVVNDVIQERAAETAAEIIRLGRRSYIATADVASAREVAAMFADMAERLGMIDIVVNNAGIVLTNPFWEVTEEQWDKIMAVNLKGVFLCCREAVAYMRRQKSGRIVNISSIAGKRGGGLFGNTVYAASKSGVIGLTKGLARELGPFGINVNAVTPGFTDTEMTSALQGEKRQALIESIPLRKAGKPANVADAVVFLASAMADFVAGEIMDVDGGFMTD
jgi:3-oxoacyl-[acyl-carrier protein] reductase